MHRSPRIRPDYADTVIPSNIAPLNFCVEEPGTRYYVKISSARGEAIEVASAKPQIVIPLREWKRLLGENRGRQLRFDVYAGGPDGSWRRFETITNTIAHEDIDAYLVYRLMNVLYNYYTKMKMYQRNLETHDESLILDNMSFGGGCMNCHTFFDNRTEKMIIQMRGGPGDCGSGMILIQDGVVSKVDTRTRFNAGLAAFASWHPSGRALAFSTNKVRQFFHSARTEVREGIDLRSDLALYVLDSHAVTSTAGISDPGRLETWPAWSPDGQHLYFCSAPLLWSEAEETPPQRYGQVKYDLMRIGYDVKTRSWRELETVLSASQTGLSITLPS
ncbi:MAG: PD40 domain-containing protein, partial [Candidatus Brocadiae bacterium]|nr:PD40 domain-containing protein [Candidatus Brocadiia bacterium]